MGYVPKSRVPKYRRHKATGQAVVSIGGRDCYLGKWNTAESHKEYRRLVAEWLARGAPQHGAAAADDITIVELIAKYWRFVQGYYRKNDRATETQDHIRRALKPVKTLYGHTLAKDFGPLALKAVREQLVASGFARTSINSAIGRIKRMFRWAASEQLIDVSIFQALATVEGLRRGRSVAKEPEPIRPVADSVVAATLAHLSPIVADMVRFERFTGCRPMEVCLIRPCDVDRSGDVWLYTPREHKTEHHGRKRIIAIGPQAQAILTPYLLRDPDSHCFRPVDAVAQFRADKNARRRTPLSCGNRPGTNVRKKPKWRPRDHYDTTTYGQAIRRAAAKAGVELWGPNRLRHAAATDIRKRFGLEAAQVTLGHARADVTQTYAERDVSLAVKVAREAG